MDKRKFLERELDRRTYLELLWLSLLWLPAGYSPDVKSPAFTPFALSVCQTPRERCTLIRKRGNDRAAALATGKAGTLALDSNCHFGVRHASDS